MHCFLDGFLNKENLYVPKPGKIIINIPIYSFSDMVKDGTAQIAGILTSEPTFVTQNKWGPIINDVSSLTDLASLANSSQVFSWVHASTLCWKGTDPIRFSAEFFLINYSREIEKSNSIGLKNFASLTALGVSDDAKFTVAPHGGYAADILSFNSSISQNYFKGLSELRGQSITPDTLSSLSDVGASIGNKGTVTVQIGENKVIPNLLVSRLDVTPSLVEVGDNGNPLYYKVGVSFTGTAPLTVPEARQIFG